MVTRKIKKPRALKVRNNGTMTESAFWSFIRSALRQKSRWWKPISQVKLEARRLYTGSNKRQKFEYQCNKCKKWFPEKKVSVDHIHQVGSLHCAEDLPNFIENLFCEKQNLQVLCNEDHDNKTKEERNLVKLKN